MSMISKFFSTIYGREIMENKKYIKNDIFIYKSQKLPTE